MKKFIVSLLVAVMVITMGVVAPAFTPKAAQADSIVKIVLPTKPGADGKYYMEVNGQKKEIDAPPFIYNGRTLVSARIITSAFGADVKWDNETRTAVFSLPVEGESISITIKDVGDKWVNTALGQAKVFSDSVEVKNTFISDDAVSVLLDVPAMNPKKIGRIYVPLRFVSETFGAAVTWDAKTKSVVIEWNKESIINPVEVTFWHAMRAKLGQTLQSLVDEFNITHPYILIKPVAQPNYGTLSQKLLAAISDGNPPVMAQAYENWVDQYLKGGILEEMGKYIDGKVAGVDPLYPADKKDIFPIFWKDTYMEGKQYMMPFNKSLRVLYVNADQLKSLGVSAPKTWESLASISKSITDRTGGKIKGIAVYVGAELWYSMVHAFGGKVMNDDLTASMYPKYPQAWEKAFGFFKDLIDQGYAYIAPPNYGDQKEFGKGNTIFYIGTTAGITYVDKAVGGKFNYDVYPLPGGAMTVEGTNLVMFKGSNITPEQQKAAWTFIRWLTSPIPQAKWSMGTGYFPIRKSSWELPMYQEYLKDNPWRNRFLPVFEGKEIGYKLLITPASSAWGKARRDVSNLASQVLKGEITPAQAAQTLHNKLQQYIQEENQ